MKRLGDIMIRNVVTVGMDDTVREVRELFERFRFHHVIVVESGRVAGVVSDRDLLKNVSPFLGKLHERSVDAATLAKKVHQVMTRRPITARESESVQAAGLLMLQHNISCLPVVSADGECVGIVTDRDLLRWCLQAAPGVREAA